MVDRQSKFIVDKRDISTKYGNKEMVNKKITKNPKYDGIKSSVDTGKSIKKVVMQSDQLISKRKSELFKRVKGGAIIKLLTDVKESIHQECIYNMGNENLNVRLNISI